MSNPNPVGARFSSENQPPSKSAKPRHSIVYHLSRLLDKKIKITDKRTKKVFTGSIGKVIAMRLLYNALDGNNEAIKEVLDRIDGKTAQKIIGEGIGVENKIVIIRADKIDTTGSGTDNIIQDCGIDSNVPLQVDKELNKLNVIGRLEINNPEIASGFDLGHDVSPDVDNGGTVVIGAETGKKGSKSGNPNDSRQEKREGTPIDPQPAALDNLHIPSNKLSISQISQPINNKELTENKVITNRKKSP